MPMRWKPEQSDFAIVRQVFPPCARPYRIIETVYTCNGPRTRMTDHVGKTLEECMSHLEALKGCKD